MADWKRQVGALNAMGKSHARAHKLELVQQRKAERINQLVEKLKAKANG